MAESKLPIDAPLTEGERRLIERLFSQPGELPADFWKAVVSRVEIGSVLHVSDMPTLKGEEWRAVGATGQPAFENSWVNYDSNRPARFMKDVLGWVHLEGIIKSGTMDTTAFTLPEGYRPGHVGSNAHFAVDAQAAYGLVTVGVNGTVTPATPSSNIWVSLATIHFRAAA